jgi:DNA (cytosine-5)-methyltransferase 1
LDCNFTHIELFAGCGGMSLGLDAAGFKLYMANELSPMAAETFAYNLLGENLLKLAEDKEVSQKVLWINSSFDRTNLKQRLRENPFAISKKGFSDIKKQIDWSNKLFVGNIDNLLEFLAHNKAASAKLRRQNIDLLSGGPPCQGFSLAGKREKDDYKNLLPLSFAKFAGLIQPKIVLLENVKGITSAFKTSDGIKHYAWLEVAKAFSLQGYIPLCMLLNSKYFGIPQNRPRFILYGFRKDIFEKIKARQNNSIHSAMLLNSENFFNKVREKRKSLNEVTIADLNLYDIENDNKFFDGSLLPKITTEPKEFVSAVSAIDDILSTENKYPLKNSKSIYARKLLQIFPQKWNNNISILQNHDHRNHSFKVKARFRLLQVFNDMNGLKQDALRLIAGRFEDEGLVERVFTAFKDQPILMEDAGAYVFDKPRSLAFFKSYLESIKSKKHSQRAIKKNEPAPSQMTIPDDLCHYSLNELRTFTVREMARFQSFPDWFVFKSKITTGGEQRNYEVPQYTQVGNAVPPLLAYELGKTIGGILNSIE